MNSNIENLLHIASDLEAKHPILAYDLSRNARRLVSVMNPEAERIEQKIERILGVLKSMRQEISKALTDHETAEEFAKWFQGGLPEEEELHRLISASRVALPNWLKRKKKEPGENAPGVSPSYKVSPEEEESFVRGEHDLESGKSIEKEKHEKDAFLSGVEDVTKMFDKARGGKADKGSLKVLLKAIDDLIKNGSKIVGGWKKPKGPSNLKKQVEHFTSLLQQNLHDEKKTAETLREFFRAVKPLMG